MILKHIQFTKSIIAVVFLLLSFYLSAATITVDAPDGAVDGTDGLCSISEAIQSANTDTAVNECPAGDGDDIINLSNDITLTTTFENNVSFGRTGTPTISSTLVMDGHGFVLQRNPALGCNSNGSTNSSEFRLLRISNTGNLAIRNITLSHGCIDGLDSSTHPSRGNGGAILNQGLISAIENASFQSNITRLEGGAISLASGSRIDVVSNTDFLGNIASGSGFGGGAIYMFEAQITLIENSLFAANTSTGSSNSGQGGGAFFIEDSVIGVIRSTTFQENNALDQQNIGAGGALYIHLTSRVDLIENSTFSMNSAVFGFGGAIYSLSQEIMNINNTTFNGNIARPNVGGGAIRTFNAQVNITNSLFVNQDGDCLDVSAGTSNNNLSDNPNSGCPGMLPITLTESTVGTLADNGGPTPTHALLAGSEALDIGDPVTSSVADQRGLPAFGVRDIGAYELQGVELCPVSLQTDGFNTTVSDPAELIQAMECANFNGEANGGDTINLSNNITLTVGYENDATFGRTGTPAISTTVTIDGQGNTLARDSSLVCNLNGSSDVGEFRLLRVTDDGDLKLNHVVIRGGCVDGNGGDGAGIYNIGTLLIQNSVIDNNLARDSGGGVLAQFNSNTQIENSTFSNNSADGQGGGLAVVFGFVSAINNSTFSNNNAFNGGGLYLDGGTISLIDNNTFSANTATGGSAIYNFQGTISNLQNSLLHGGSTCRVDSVFNGSNNMADASSTGCPGVLPTPLTTASLGPLADNGCTMPLADGSCVMTHALLASSEALDSAVSGTSSDQRGFPAFATRDIGAFEAQIPVVMAPADVNIEATGPLTSPALGVATVTDADEPTLTTATPSPANDFVVGNTVVTWSATDVYGHIGSDTQNVTIVDTTPPVISLLGADPITLLVGDAYTDAGATATDLVDDDAILTSGIAVTDLPNTSMAGSYVINYNVSDKAGNATTITRTVNVLATVGGSLTGLAAGNSVTIQNNSGDDITANTNGNFTFATALADGSAYAVTVSQQPSNQTCVVNNGTGTLAVSHVTDVQVNCADNSISLSSNSLDYGSVFIGNQTNETVIVTNNGSSDVMITDITSPAAPFIITGGSCSGLPVTLSAGGSCEITVQFNPVDEGDFDGSFQIISNAGSSPDEVTLSGSSRILTVPTLSQWSLMLLSLLVLVVVYKKRLNLY